MRARRSLQAALAVAYFGFLKVNDGRQLQNKSHKEGAPPRYEEGALPSYEGAFPSYEEGAFPSY